MGLRAAGAPRRSRSMSDHCRPEPGWAAALIQAYGEPWAAVGYAFRDSPGARYGARAARSPTTASVACRRHLGGAVDAISSGEASYRREFLDGFGERLDWALDSDFATPQSHCTRKWLTMGVEPDSIAHDNLATVRANGWLSYHSSRLVGARHLGDCRATFARRLLRARRADRRPGAADAEAGSHTARIDPRAAAGGRPGDRGQERLRRLRPGTRLSPRRRRCREAADGRRAALAPLRLTHGLGQTDIGLATRLGDHPGVRVSGDDRQHAAGVARPGIRRVRDRRRGLPPPATRPRSSWRPSSRRSPTSARRGA